jgi:hypothetical protein
MPHPSELPPPDDLGEPLPWSHGRKGSGLVSSLLRLLFIGAILAAIILPFTPVATRVKNLLKDAREPRVITREVIRKVEVQVPAPPPPLPEKSIPRKEVDVATLFNGITVSTSLSTSEGSFASRERLDPEAYQAKFQLDIRIPQANQSLDELSRINPDLPSILPGLANMLPTAKVSGFFHQLYENKTKYVTNSITRLNKALDRHNFFDCETILEMKHPGTGQKVMLIQSEMDVVADGSDGDRAPSLDDYISMSDYYQPFTSYAWPKQTKTPNPLLARWESRLREAEKEYAVKGLSSTRNRELKSTIDQLKLEIKDLKARSSLIADSDPFIVISLLFRNYEGNNEYAPQIGDFAVVIHEKKIYPAICGDYGPSFKMGEASLFMAKAINPKATPYHRPESDLTVSYIIFPGSRVKPNTAPNLEAWKAACLEHLNRIGGIGAGYEMHTWEDKFKKPAPSPTPAPVTPLPTPTPEATIPATETVNPPAP